MGKLYISSRFPKPFEKEEELQTKQKRLIQLTCELQLDKSDTEIIDEDDVEAPEQVKKNEDRCR